MSLVTLRRGPFFQPVRIFLSGALSTAQPLDVNGCHDEFMFVMVQK